jgi:hypothetical protein
MHRVRKVIADGEDLSEPEFVRELALVTHRDGHIVPVTVAIKVLHQSLALSSPQEGSEGFSEPRVLLIMWAVINDVNYILVHNADSAACLSASAAARCLRRCHDVGWSSLLPDDARRAHAQHVLNGRLVTAVRTALNLPTSGFLVSRARSHRQSSCPLRASCAPCATTS